MSRFSKVFIAVIIIISCLYVYDNYFKNPDFLNKFKFLNKEKVQTEDIKKEDIEVKSQNDENSELKNITGESYVYFLGIDKSGNSVFKKVKRQVDNDNKLENAIEQLLKGPSLSEKSLGIYNEIPKGTKLLSIKGSGNDVVVNLSSDFQYGGGADSIYSRMKQLIKTVLVNAPGKNVYLYLDGKQADVIGGEGLMITQPLSENSLDE